jgi:hypothetical protein
MKDHGKPKWKKNQAGDGYMPVCPNCKEVFGDADIFDVKNYPEDGGALLFLECEKCEYEAQLNFNWDQFVPEIFG